MAIVCGIFDSTTYEMVGNFPRGNKALSSDAMAKMFGALVGNGVMPQPLTCMAVIAKSGMTVTRKAGYCMINGRFAYDDSDSDYTFTTSTSVQTVWVVMRLDLGTGDITCKYLTDTTNLPLRTETQWDIVLAKIFIPANAVTVTDAMITDCRYDNTLCGVISGALGGGVDVDAIYTAINTKFTATVNGDGDMFLSNDGTYRVPPMVKYQLAATLTSSGTFDPTQYPSKGNMYKLVLIGGGASGGGGAYRNSSTGTTYVKGGGGGGAGGITETEIDISSPTPYQIGSGGIGGAKAAAETSTVLANNGTDGGDTTILGYTAKGGKKGTKGASSTADTLQYGKGGLGGVGKTNGTNGTESEQKSVGNPSASNRIESIGGIGGTNTLYPTYGNGGQGGTSSSYGYTDSSSAGKNGGDGAILVYSLQEVTA